MENQQKSVSKSLTMEFLRRLPKKTLKEDSEAHRNLCKFNPILKRRKIRSSVEIPQGRILIQHYS